jgi:DNA-binding GntR family transcriptional regulator
VKFHSHAAPAGPRTPRPTSARAARQRRRTAPESLGDIAYAGIRERITSLALPPGSAVNEAALAAELGVGLAPVRSALRRLAWENLVVILPRRGTLVADVNAADTSALFEVRNELEGLAADLAAQRATPRQLTALADLVERTRAALAPEHPDHHRLIHLDREMHELLAEAAHNEVLAQNLDTLYVHVMRLWNVAIERIGELPGAIEEHFGIAEAVRTGDGALARSLMREHVAHFQQSYTRALS